MRAFFSFTRVLPVLSSVSSLFTCPSFSLTPKAADVLATHTRAVAPMGREDRNRKVKDSMSLAIAVL